MLLVVFRTGVTANLDDLTIDPGPDSPDGQKNKKPVR